MVNLQTLNREVMGSILNKALVGGSFFFLTNSKDSNKKMVPEMDSNGPIHTRITLGSRTRRYSINIPMTVRIHHSTGASPMESIYG